MKKISLDNKWIEDCICALRKASFFQRASRKQLLCFAAKWSLLWKTFLEWQKTKQNNRNAFGIRNEDLFFFEEDIQVFIFSVKRGPFLEEFYQCVTYGFYTAQWQEQLYTTLSLILMFLLPLLVLVSTYIATFLTIANSGQENMFSERVSLSAIDSARQKILRKAKVKSLMITVVIVFTFLVCWTPYYVTMIIFMFLDPSEQLSQDLQRAIFFFGSSTAAINPLIYGAFHLRPRRRRRSKSTTSLAINSSSSRLTSRILSRKSREESIALQLNGEFLTHTASLYKPRYSCISNVEHANRIIRQDSIAY